MSEWDQRELCPDGTCTGVIGGDGVCKTCGRAAPNWGDERKRGLIAADDTDDDEDEDEDDDDDDDDDGTDDGDEDPISPSAPAVLGGAGEWTERELCSNGACVGVLDDTGVCKVCGTKAPGFKPRVGRTAPAPAEEAALAVAAADLAASVPAEAVDSIAPAPAADEGAAEEPRALCPDGACVGVIGDNGTCKLCGKEAA